MDPATIFQIVGTVVSLGDVVIKCITRLSALKAQFHDAPIIVTSMIGQLHMVKIAQDQLSPLNSPNFGRDPRYRQLADQIGNALDSFGPILLALSQQLDRYEGIGADRMTVKTRMGFLHGEREMTNLSILLDRQVNALNLLLQAIQCRTWTEQSDMITQRESQSVLRLAQDCSSSLVGLEDVASFISENTAALSTQFEFDDVLRGTLLYQAAERSHLRQAIRANRQRDIEKTSTNSLPQKIGTFGFKRTFRAMKGSRSTAASGTPDDTQQAIRIDIHRDVIVETSGENGNDVTEEAPRRENNSHDNSRASGGTDSDTGTGQPTPSLLSRTDPSSPRSPAGFASWRRAFQRQKPDARETIPSQIKEKIHDCKVAKILLLGVSGGGKTTLLNALRLFAEAEHFKHDEGYLRALVWENALGSVRTVLRTMEKLDMVTEGMASAHAALLDGCLDCDRDPALNPGHTNEIARVISYLRSKEGFRNAMKSTEVYQFHDNREYYINNISRLAEQAAHRLAPTDEDLLRTRVTTTGIHQATITYNGAQYDVYDLGGERSERKKWIHVFEDVSTIVWPIDTTGYSKSLREDEDGNQMAENFMLFESIFNSHWFRRSNFIIVFTKMDVLETCLKETSVDAFLKRSGIIPHGQSYTTTASEYLRHIEKYLLGLVRSPEVQQRVRFLRANLVDIEHHNPAIDILNMLESFRLPGSAVTSGAEIAERARKQPPKITVSFETDELSAEDSRLDTGRPPAREAEGSSQEKLASRESDELSSEHWSLDSERPLGGNVEEVIWPLIGAAR